MEVIKAMRRGASYEEISEIIDNLEAENPDALYETDDYGNTALMTACSYTTPQLALRLIASGYSGPNTVNMYGDTALMIACRNGVTDVVLKLIEIGQDPGQIVNSYGKNITLLMLAIQFFNPETALALIETGRSNPGYIDHYRHTALMYACINGRFDGMEDVAIALLDTGESVPEQVNNFRKTAFDYARENGLMRVLNYESNKKMRKDMTNYARASKRGTLKKLPEDMNVTIASYLVPPNKNTIQLYGKDTGVTGGKSKRKRRKRRQTKRRQTKRRS